jgi:hypothetical protein
VGAYRESIFQLRAQGLSQRQIAAQLGISKTLVVKELGRPANQVGGDDDAEPVTPGVTTPVLDPLAESSRSARLALDAERAEVQRIQLQLQKAELQRRLQLMAAPAQDGGTSQLLLAVLNRLDRLGQPAEHAAPSLTDQLNQVKAVQETVSSFAPAPMTGPDALAYQASAERLKQESRDLEIRREWERADRDEKLAIERRRADAFATVIEQWGPVIGAGIQSWLERQSQPASTALAVVDGGRSQPPAAAPGSPNGSVEPATGAEVIGPCPRCRTTIAIRAEGPDSCPRCGLELVNQDGRLFPRVPQGQPVDPPSFTG